MEHTPEEHILEEYGDFADDYEETLRGYGYLADRMGPAMAAEELAASGAALGPPWQVLDLGCGTGNTSAFYFETPERYSVVGIDLTPEMVEKARQRPFVKLVCQNVEAELPFEDGTFALVQMIGVTEFINRPVETFSHIRRKLQPGGLLLVTVPQKIAKEKEVKYKIRTYMKGEFEQHIEKSGFNCIRTQDFLGYQLPDVAVHYVCGLWRPS
uniref:Methyltransferase type 11 domain-containing protein n=1 Tax=Alexandrium monilatum TaxID=311494 RepID=A0A7S4QW89_9DINO